MLLTLLMASPLKRKFNKFPYGIINESIIATINQTFSYLYQTGRPGLGAPPSVKFVGVLSRISRVYFISCSNYPQKGYSFW